MFYSNFSTIYSNKNEEEYLCSLTNTFNGQGYAYSYKTNNICIPSLIPGFFIIKVATKNKRMEFSLLNEKLEELELVYFSNADLMLNAIIRNKFFHNTSDIINIKTKILNDTMVSVKIEITCTTDPYDKKEFNFSLFKPKDENNKVYLLDNELLQKVILNNSILTVNEDNSDFNKALISKAKVNQIVFWDSVNNHLELASSSGNILDNISFNLKEDNDSYLIKLLNISISKTEKQYLVQLPDNRFLIETEDSINKYYKDITIF